MHTMKAIVIRDIGKLEYCELPIPRITQPDDVLIKVSAVGICGSDIKIVEGKHHFRKDIALGHEFTGTVDMIGSSARLSKTTACGAGVTLELRTR